MLYVPHAEYFELIENSQDPTHTKPEFYLFNMYEIYKSKDAHFLERLKITKNNLFDKIYNYSCDKHGHEHYWESQLFYLYHSQIYIVDNNDTTELSPFHIMLLITPYIYNQSYENFIKMIQNSVENITTNNEILQLKWKGQKNQLYSLIRQIKLEHQMLDETYEDLAIFLKQSFSFFNETKLSTILKELNKDHTLPENLAKKKRMQVDPNKE